jgi:phage terminase small subunit
MGKKVTEIKLTDKQESFCQAYLIDFNATKAAKLAGYSEDTAHSIGWENLRKPEIQKRITELREQTGKTYNVTRERIAQELARIGFMDIRNIFDENGVLKSPDNWPDDEAAAIAGLESEQIFEGFGEERTWTGYLKKVKLSDKRAALDSLSKLMGYNEPDKVQHSGDIDFTF